MNACIPKYITIMHPSFFLGFKILWTYHPVNNLVEMILKLALVYTDGWLKKIVCLRSGLDVVKTSEIVAI